MAEGLAVQVSENQVSVVAGFNNAQGFDLMQRMAKALCSSDLVPKEYRNNIPNTMIALEIAHKLGTSPLTVMQNLCIVQGKPGWSSQFIIAMVNSTNKFSPLRFDVVDDIEKIVEAEISEYDKISGTKKTKIIKEKIKNQICLAWAIEKATGEKLVSPTVSIELAVREGWYSKNGSKWKTMPDLMLCYRAATFFGRLYAPEVLHGLQTAEEVIDVVDIEPTPSAKTVMERFAKPEILYPKIDNIPEFISADKIEILKASLKSNKKSIEEFLHWAGKDRIEDITVSEFERHLEWASS